MKRLLLIGLNLFKDGKEPKVSYTIGSAFQRKKFSNEIIPERYEKHQYLEDYFGH